MSSPTEFRLQRVDARTGPIALVTMDNGEDWRRPSTFGEHALRSLDELLARLRTPDWRGLLLTGKPFVFAAGALPAPKRRLRTMGVLLSERVSR